ncbi:MAG: alpha/beta hydrolase [Bacteroidales bacterium]|nr:alpha/beta hydrolase [Bacteroidales bacterium]
MRESKSYFQSKDECNSSFWVRSIPLKPDWQGDVLATLVYRPTEKVGEPKKAVLYIHGFIDYFFQWEMADFYNTLGFDFYAIDLRKYGRSLLAHQLPNIIDKVETYYEELDLVLDIIREQSDSPDIFLMGHSTGGLLASLFAHDRPHSFKGVLLNSPFFEFNLPWALRKIAIPIVSLIAPVFPTLSVDALPELYPKSLHHDHFGEWKFNTDWKPIQNFPAYFMWLKAIRNGHKRVHAGLNIDCPVLVMHSDKSFKKLRFSPEAMSADAVLNVEDIAKYGRKIGSLVQISVIENGMHDLVLSAPEVRKNVYQVMRNWLKLIYEMD